MGAQRVPYLPLDRRMPKTFDETRPTIARDEIGFFEFHTCWNKIKGVKTIFRPTTVYPDVDVHTDGHC